MNKRILLIGISFNDAYGAGVTLRNLFSGISPENIGVVDYSVTLDDLKYAKSLYKLGRYEKPLVQHNLDDAETIIENPESLQYKKSPLKLNFILLLLLSLRKYLAYYYNNYSKIRFSKTLENFISSFNPDFIYVIPYNRRMIRFALKIGKDFNIPIVSHFMDDYRKRSPRDLFYFINESLTTGKIKKLVNNSYECLAICESMADEYQKIFKRLFHPFHNPINTHLYQKEKVSGLNESRQILKVVYTGTIAENNFDALIAFSSACEKINRSGIKMSFDIYSPTNLTNVFFRRLETKIKNYNSVKRNEKLDHSQIIPALYKYDLLLLPLTFTRRYKHVIKVSFPTKVAEYMASGIPILFLVPKDIALHDFILKYKVGYLIDELNEERIQSSLKSLINNNPTTSIDHKARQIAFEKFDIRQVSLEFSKIFS